jgi:hypothetical protein
MVKLVGRCDGGDRQVGEQTDRLNGLSICNDGVRRRQVAARTLCAWVTNRYSALVRCDAQQIGARKPQFFNEKMTIEHDLDASRLIGHCQEYRQAIQE